MTREKEFGSHRLVSAVYFGFAVLFLALYVPFHPFRLSFLIKGAPVAILLVLTLAVKRGYVRAFLSLGLLFSLGGDILLDIDRTRFFLPGLASFLVAHVFYIVLFLKGVRYRNRALPLLAATVIYAAAVAWLLRGIEAGFLVPVMFYLGVITVMAGSAAVYSAANSWKGSNLVAIGAWFFMVSDSTIAVNQFLAEIPHSLLISLPLYWAAQFLIVRGIHLSD